MDELNVDSESLYGSLKVSVVVPVYGGSAALEVLCERVSSVMREANFSYEILLVDDRGQKEAWGIIRSIAEINPTRQGTPSWKKFRPARSNDMRDSQFERRLDHHDGR